VFFYVTLLNLVDFAKEKLDRENGATAVEYGLMVALIAVAIIAAVIALQGKLTGIFNYVSGKLTAPAA
jgi:pilus assembly protein Flp/PilA